VPALIKVIIPTYSLPLHCRSIVYRGRPGCRLWLLCLSGHQS